MSATPEAILQRKRRTIVQLLPALQSGGVERSTLEIARALVAAGHRSVVISAGGAMVERLQAEGSEHIRLDIGHKSIFVLGQVLALRSALRRLDADLVHARSRLPAWLARAALALMGRQRPRFVTSVHGLNSPGRYSGVMASGERVICVSGTVRAHVRQHWPRVPAERLQVIARGIDPAEFPRDLAADAEWRAERARQYPALAAGKLLLLPGRGTRLKGHRAALELVAALRAQGRDVRLWLLGVRAEGRQAYLAELETLAAKLGVASTLAMTPARDDVQKAYACADLVLQMSSRPEAFGRTVLEALAMGRPVLGWDLGGVGETLREHYPDGAVRAGDWNAMIGRAQRLLEDPPPVPVLPNSLAAMQSATLALYDSLCAD